MSTSILKLAYGCSLGIEEERGSLISARPLSQRVSCKITEVPVKPSGDGLLEPDNRSVFVVSKFRDTASKGA